MQRGLYQQLCLEFMDALFYMQQDLWRRSYKAYAYSLQGGEFWWPSLRGQGSRRVRVQHGAMSDHMRVDHMESVVDLFHNVWVWLADA